MARFLGSTGSRRRRGYQMAAIFSMVALLALIAVPAALAWNSTTDGVENTGLFALDRNTLPITCGGDTNGADDWAALYTDLTDGDSTDPNCSSDAFKFVNDGVGSADHTYWSAGGSKDAYDPALGPWQWKPNDVAPDKNDIVNAFAAIYKVPDTAPSGGTVPILFFGADRFNTNGDAQMGFQFLKSAVCLAGPVSGVSPGGDANCPSGTPNQTANAGSFVDPNTGDPIHHQNGDLLILINFNKGGTIGLAGVFEWTGALGNGEGQYTNVLTSGTGANNPPADCVGPPKVGDPNDFCATASTGNETGDPVWPYTAKGGGTSYAASSFIEGGVNLNRVTTAGACFPTFIAETRSSAGPSSGLSLQAQLKDLAVGRFQLCAPDTSLSASASKTTIRGGESTTLTFTEDNTGNETLINNQVVTDFSACGNNGTLTTPATGDTNSNNKLEASETWTFTCTISPSSTVTVHAYAEGTGETSGILVTGNPTCTSTATKVCSAAERAEVTITVISPATSLTQNASIAVTFTYLEANTGNDDLSSPTVTDTNCSPVTGVDANSDGFNDGDTNSDGKLSVGETWKFTCTKAATASGTDVSYTAAATGSGTDSLGGAVGGASDPKENESVDVSVTHHHHS